MDNSNSQNNDDRIRQALQPHNFLKLVRIVEVMSTDVVCAPATTTVQSLAQLMTERSVSCVVLVESRKDSRPAEGDAPLLIPIGIVTERDIIQFQALGLNFARTPADAVMSAPLFLMQPQNSLWSAYQQMQERHVRRVVIAGDRGELVGIVT